MRTQWQQHQVQYRGRQIVMVQANRSGFEPGATVCINGDGRYEYETTLDGKNRTTMASTYERSELEVFKKEGDDKSWNPSMKVNTYATLHPGEY